MRARNSVEVGWRNASRCAAVARKIPTGLGSRLAPIDFTAHFGMVQPLLLRGRLEIVLARPAASQFH